MQCLQRISGNNKKQWTVPSLLSISEPELPILTYVGLLTCKLYSNNTRIEDDLKQSNPNTEELPRVLSSAIAVCDAHCKPKKSISSAFFE